MESTKSNKLQSNIQGDEVMRILNRQLAECAENIKALEVIVLLKMSSFCTCRHFNHSILTVNKARFFHLILKLLFLKHLKWKMEKKYLFSNSSNCNCWISDRRKRINKIFVPEYKFLFESIMQLSK